MLRSLAGNCVPTHEMLLTYTRDILSGLAYMHELNVLHLDLKADNCLLDASGTIKLADFGTSKQVVVRKSRSGSGGGEESYAMVGTPYVVHPSAMTQPLFALAFSASRAASS